ncbi:hypothetical protein [Mumia sp. ZJ430]|uniref:hypothetical protein n=1 Tax=Mumia sp. ZJ430 TaxID=2708083 RepID=UPI0014204E2F|nr:hypothetical protein [Mumia sp. ZJ430]
MTPALSLVGATFVSRLDVIRTTARRALAVRCAASAVVYSVLAVATGNPEPPASGQTALTIAGLALALAAAATVVGSRNGEGPASRAEASRSRADEDRSVSP